MSGAITTYVDENGDLVTYDVVSGTVIQVQPQQRYPSTATSTPQPSPTTSVPRDTPPTTVGAGPAPTPSPTPVGAGGTGVAPGADPYASAISPGSAPMSVPYGNVAAGGPDPSKKIDYTRGPTVKGPGGFYYLYTDGTLSPLQTDNPAPDDIDQQTRQAQLDILLQRVAAGENSGAGATVTAAGIQAQSAANSLAEQKRQFDLNLANAQTPAERAALLAEQQRQFDKGQDLDRGKTLLSLGSRPDTLIKYLYALRGQQTPQGIMNTTANLPGFTNSIAGVPGVPGVAGVPAPGAPGAGAAGPQPVAAAPQIAAAQQQATDRTQQASTMAPNSGVALNTQLPNIGVGGSAPKLPQPPLQLANNASGQSQVQFPTGSGAQGVIPAGAAIANVQTGASGTAAPVSLSDWAVKNGFNLAPYAQGGVIPEPVIGVGMHSGQMYQFGEQAPGQPEVVVPKNKVPDTIFDQLTRGDGEIDYSEDDGKTRRRVKVNKYATGGTIGYGPTNTPGLGSQAAGLFNDPRLQEVVARGYNSSPQTPLFPQIGAATNQGQSLVASSQRLNSLLPSEQGVYSGALQDEFGVVPDDVFALARKLAPQVNGLRTPRFTN